MRALTVRQPHASLIVAGIKPVENRTWAVPSTMTRLCLGSHDRPQRGDDFPADDPEPCMCGPAPFRLAIHAGKQDDSAATGAWEELARHRGGTSWLHGMATLIAMLPRGALIGFVTVTGCHHASECVDTSTGELCSPWADWRRVGQTSGVYHWVMADPVALDEPIPMRGRQGLWNLPDDVLAEVPA